MGWNKSTALVKSLCANGKYKFGTGFGVRQGWLLTAKHVLQADINPPRVIVRWQHTEVPGFRAGDDEDGFQTAEDVVLHPTLDAALVKCSMPDDVSCVSIARAPHSAGPFDSEGYPTGAKYKGSPHHIRIHGDAQTKDGSDSKFQVTMDNNPADLTDWQGLSGGAVIQRSTGQAIGLFEVTREIFGESRTAWAVPMESLFDDESFSEILSGHRPVEAASKKEIEQHRKSIRCLIVKSIEDLHIDDRSELFKRGGEAGDWSTATCSEICDWFVELSPEEAWQLIRAVHRDLDADLVERKKSLLDLSTLLAMFSLPKEALDHVLFVKRDRTASDGFVVAGTAYSMVGIELSAASIDEQTPDFERGTGKGATPYGSFAMPFVTPEAGPDASNEIADVLDHLNMETGLSAIAAEQLRPQAEAYLANERELVTSSRLRSGQMLEPRAAKRLSRELDRLTDDGKRSFYFTVVWPDDEVLRTDLREKLVEFRRLYPSVLVLGLGIDEDELDREERQYGRLISTIKDE